MAEATKPAEVTPKAADTAPVKEEKPKSSLDYQAISAWVLENLLLVIAGVLGLIAIVIAWAMRAAGMRNDYDSEDDEVSSEIDEAVASYFRNPQTHGHESSDTIHHGLMSKTEATETLNKIDLDLNSPVKDDIVTLNTAADSTKSEKSI